MKTAQDAIALLGIAGIVAHWEYPGYISVPLADDFAIAYGDDGTWYGSVIGPAGGAIADTEIAELPSTATAQEIAAVLLDAYRARVSS